MHKVFESFFDKVQKPSDIFYMCAKINQVLTCLQVRSTKLGSNYFSMIYVELLIYSRN